MLAQMRAFDRPGSGPAAASVIQSFEADLTQLCGAGADCTNPDLYCDSDLVAEAAIPAYASDLAIYRP
jgi:hypothetical protein